MKIVAKFADACNLIGSLETIKRKLTVLREHCETVGRDYDSILKTKLCTVIINDDANTAKKGYKTYLMECLKNKSENLQYTEHMKKYADR